LFYMPSGHLPLLLEANSPLIEAHIVLDKQQDLIGQIRRPQCSSEVDMF
jgi:hypothetical protein